MDDKIIYYLIIGAIYILYNWLKRKKQPLDNPADVDPPQGQATSQSQPKPLTFEELLREITEGKQQKPEPVIEYEQPQTPHHEYVDYDDDLQGEAEEQEEEKAYDYKKEVTYQQFEEAKQQAFYRKSMEETTRIEDVNIEFGRFKEFDKAQHRNLLEEYTKDLRDPEGFKKAFVLSEILNRKDF
ncbi:MAG: hypothetical protein ACK4RF_10800 [Cyclobacteriaceae bacterium]